MDSRGSLIASKIDIALLDTASFTDALSVRAVLARSKFARLCSDERAGGAGL
jgi:hypothetical protein